MNELPSLAVVIPVYNQSHHTERCLKSLLAHSTVARELIVIDNASSDQTGVLLKSMELLFQSQGWIFQIIRNEENRGFGRACNQGIRASKAERVAILNNDTWLMADWDQALLQAMERAKADLIAPFFDETPWSEAEMQERAIRFVRRNHGKVARRWVSILMLFKRSSIKKLSEDPSDPGRLFDERFFVTCEDNDVRERMDRLKMNYFQSSDCYIWHHSKGTRSSLSSDHEKEGLRLFFEKWGFDPRDGEKAMTTRLKRAWIKWKSKQGLF